MTETRRVRTIFERARDLPQQERMAFVVREAGDDSAVRTQVMALLEQLSTHANPLPENDADSKVTLASGDPGGESAVLSELKNRAQPAWRYRFVKDIEKGGMGQVSKIFDPDLRRHLAMKVLLDEKVGFLPRLLEEAQVMGQLDHPNIVPVHELGIDPAGRVFFTMKLVKGETLRDVFDKVRDNAEGWNVTRTLSVILRICEAMAFAHAKGVLHRDLKPANIMIGRFGEVYVMDWGLARVLGHRDTKDIRIRPDDSIRSVNTEQRDKKASDPIDLGSSPLRTMDGAIIGTPSYMPPEQAEGVLEAIGPQADVYAIGALLYRLLSGREPYTEPGSHLSGKQIIARVIAGPPRPLHQFVKDVPAELLAIQEKAMAREIRDRYPSMTALADDLRAYLEKRVVAAYETGAFAELKKWVERNQGLAAAAALLILVLAGASVLLSLKNQQIQQQKADVDAKNVEITAQQTEVEKRGAEIALRKAQFDQLAGVVKLERAKLAETALYPARPQKIPALENWLGAEAAELIDLEPSLAATLAELESSAVRSGAEDSPTLVFADPARVFLYSTLKKLAEDIATFEATTHAEVEARLEWARKIGALTLHHPNAKVSWDEARTAIAQADGVVASKLYADSPAAPIQLQPQIGLVPIGMNPVTKLWEFYDLRSACDVDSGQDPATLEIPTLEPDGKVRVQPATGIVLVLLPGGTFLQGAQKHDESGSNYDPRAEADESDDGEPVPVTLGPFLIGKYELTQGQWLRLAGSNPSFWMAEHPRMTSLDRPIENVSWDDCASLAHRFGLELPTEARWEYACRAGTTSVFFFGREDAGMATHGNVRDMTYESVISNTDPASCDPFEDGEAIPCVVGSYSPNAFGLYDVHGNVWEWCQDTLSPYSSAARDGDGLRDSVSSTLRVLRGGGCGVRSSFARAGRRNRDASGFHNGNLGVRVARSLDRQ